MIPRFKPYFDNEEIKAIINKKHENIIHDFEKEFAKLVGSKYALSFSSGRIILYALLKQLNIKKNNVLLPAYTCIVVPAAVTASNNNLCFADISLSDYNIKTENISPYNSKKIECVVPTSMYGYPVDVKAIRECTDSDTYIIEDAAQGILTKDIGKYSDAAFYSFNFEKQIFTFGGGMLTTNNKEIYNKLKKFKEENIVKTPYTNKIITAFLLLKTPFIFSNTFFKPILSLWEKNALIQWKKEGWDIYNSDFPIEKVYLNKDQFYDYSKIQAAVGLAQIKKIHETIKKRIKISKYYNDQLSNVKEIILPPIKEGCTFCHYTIRVKNRNRFEKFMMKRNIQINKVFDYSIPHLPVYQKYVKKSEEFPNSLIAGKNNVNLPIHTQLLDKKNQLDYIVNSIKEYSKNS